MKSFKFHPLGSIQVFRSAVCWYNPPMGAESGRVRRSGRRLLAALGILSAFAITLAACGSSSPAADDAEATPVRTAPGAEVGEHWHAALTIRVCGQNLVEPQFPGEIHTHGDGLMHIHPGSDGSAGKNATLRTYFEGSQIGLTASSILVPGLPEFTGGTECPNGSPGQLSVRINDGERAGFLDYPLQDGDRIDIVFE